MAKISFGYNNDNHLNSQFEGYENDGEFIDIVSYLESHYLITKINNIYDVKEVSQDMFADGSYATYANQRKNENCKTIIMILNRPEVQDTLAKGISVIETLKMGGLEVYPSSLKTVTTEYEDIPGIVTSIKPEMFNDLMKTRRFNHKSHYELCKQVEFLQMQLNQLKQEQEHNIKM